MPVDRILEREAESGRTPQIEDTVAAMEEDLAAAGDVPVLLLGDFNSPPTWTGPRPTGRRTAATPTSPGPPPRCPPRPG
ncbi:hypothetical protein ACFQXA_16070 [Nocardiopsis composta]